MSILTHVFQAVLVLNAVALAWFVGRGIGYGGHSADWGCNCRDGCNDCRDVEREAAE